MSSFAYVAFDAHGRETQGSLDVLDQDEALRRIKEMGYFPTKVVLRPPKKMAARNVVRSGAKKGILYSSIPLMGAGVKAKTLCVFTRQMATLLEAGMPIVRGLRLLEEQETNPNLKRIIGEVCFIVEGGDTLKEEYSHSPH